MKNRKLLAIIAAAMVAAQGAAIGFADAPALSVDGKALDAEILVKGENKMLPLRALAETVGYEVEWVSESGTVILKGDGEPITLQPKAADAAMARTVDALAEIHNDRTYVPVSFVNDGLGLAFEEDEKGNINVFSAPVQEEASLVRTVTVNSVGDGEISVEDEIIGEVILKISEETKITKAGEAAALSDITEDSVLTVEYSPAMTMSLPPQTTAVSIEIVTEDAEAEENVTYEGEISEITEDGFVIVKAENDPYGVALKMTENTEISHSVNKRIYKAEDLEVGMEVTVAHSNAMTKSLPPQAEAISIVIK